MPWIICKGAGDGHAYFFSRRVTPAAPPPIAAVANCTTLMGTRKISGTRPSATRAKVKAEIKAALISDPPAP